MERGEKKLSPPILHQQAATVHFVQGNAPVKQPRGKERGVKDLGTATWWGDITEWITEFA